MTPKRFAGDERGSAVRWFAYAAAGLTLLSIAAAQGLARLADAGRLPSIAFHGPAGQPSRRSGNGDLDPTPTGSVAGMALVPLRR